MDVYYTCVNLGNEICFFFCGEVKKHVNKQATQKEKIVILKAMNRKCNVHYKEISDFAFF